MSLKHPSLSLSCKCISLFLKYLVTVTFGWVCSLLSISLPPFLSLSLLGLLPFSDSSYAVMRMNNNQRFMEEFSTIPDHPKEVANLERNLVKNRYDNILLYDHTRVKLSTVKWQEGSDSDYINASFLDVSIVHVHAVHINHA